MQRAFVVTGSVADARTVRLDEALPIGEGKVRVVLEVIVPDVAPTYAEVIDSIRRRQRERGFVPPTREGVDSALEAERNGWDERA